MAIKRSRNELEIFYDTGVTLPNHKALCDTIVCNHEVAEMLTPKRGVPVYPPAQGEYHDKTMIGEGEVVAVLRLPGMEFQVCPMILNGLPVGYIRRYGYFMGISRQLMTLDSPEDLRMLAASRQGIFETPNLTLSTIHCGQYLRLGEAATNKDTHTPIFKNEMKNQSRVLACLEPITTHVVEEEKIKEPRSFQLLNRLYSSWDYNETKLPVLDKHLMWHLFVVSVLLRLQSLDETLLTDYSNYKNETAFFLKPQYRKFYTDAETIEELFSDGYIDPDTNLHVFAVDDVKQSMNAFVFWCHYFIYMRMSDIAPGQPMDSADPLGDIELQQIGERAFSFCHLLPALAVAMDIGHQPLSGADSFLGLYWLKQKQRRHQQIGSNIDADEVIDKEETISEAVMFFNECVATMGNRSGSSFEICGVAISPCSIPGQGIIVSLI